MAKKDDAMIPDPAAQLRGERAEEHVAIPRWLAPVLYLAVALLLFRAFVFSDAMLFGSDTLGGGYMARAFFAERLAAGDFPLWAPRLLGGTPFLESLSGGDSLYPPSLLLLLLLEPYRSLGWKLVLHVVVGGLAMFGFTRSLGRSRAAALTAGLAYEVAPFFVTLVYPGHDGKLFVTALAPLLFWAVHAWFRKRSFLPLAGIAAVVALVLLTTHFQMAYFLFGAVGVYAVVLTFQEGRRAGASFTRATGSFWAFLAASVVGASAAGVQLLPAIDYITEHSRRTATTTRASAEENRVYGSSWSLHPEEVMAALAVPEFVGVDVARDGWAGQTYWGRNAFKLNHEYIGVVVLLLAGLAFLGPHRPRSRWYFLGMGGVALLYALGEHTPIWGIFYDILPGIDLFRAPSMAIFLTGLCAIVLMSFGVDRVLGWAAGADPGGADLGLKIVWIVTAVFFVGTLLAASGVLVSGWVGMLYGDLQGQALQALERARPFIGRGFLAATALLFALGGTLLLGRRKALRPSGVTIVIALIVALDGLRVDAPFVQVRDFESFASPTPNAEFLLARQAEEPPFRVIDMEGAGQEVILAQFGLELASGHHPNDLARYRELTGMVGSGQPRNLLVSANLNRILNVRYLAWPAYRYGAVESQIPLEMDAVSATQTGDGRLYEVVYEMETLPRARLVASARVVEDDEAVAVMMEPSFDPATTAVLAEAPPLGLDGETPGGTVEWLEREPDRQRLRVSTDRNALLIIADNWYPQWRATVDGVETPILRAYHTLRAIPVQAGEHEVELVYPFEGPLRSGLGLSIAAWLVIGLLAGLGLLRRRGRGRGSEA